MPLQRNIAITEIYLTVISGLSGPVGYKTSATQNAIPFRLPPLAPIDGYNLAHVITHTTPNKNQFLLSFCSIFT